MKTRRLLGEGLDSCSVEELQCIENQLEKSLNKIRTRRVSYISISSYSFVYHFNDTIQTLLRLILLRYSLSMAILQSQLMREKIDSLKFEVNHTKKKVSVHIE